VRSRHCAEEPVRLRIEDDRGDALARRECHMSYVRVGEQGCNPT
jgi:hypothetical protein